MKCVLDDIRRALRGRWFIIAVAASAGALYLSIGRDTCYLIGLLRGKEYDDFRFTLADLLLRGMLGEFGAMTFPALTALPFAAQPLQEIKSGALRPAVFRVERKGWVLGKGVTCILAGMLLPLIAALLLAGILHGIMLVDGGGWFPAGDLSILVRPLIVRMLSGGVWAGVGCVVALLSETAAAACLAPLCLCYALTMIGTRFFPQIAPLNPANWLMGELWVPAILLTLVVAAVLLTLRREVLRHA